jgi:uncharacterized protein YjiS (DUF1127 family)
MNALIHSFDRVEPPPQRQTRPGFLRATLLRLLARLREGRDRRALAHLSEWNEHMLRDVGLTREDVARRAPPRPLSDGQWLIDNARLTER